MGQELTLIGRGFSALVLAEKVRLWTPLRRADQDRESRIIGFERTYHIRRHRPRLLWVEPLRLQEQTAAGCSPVNGPRQRMWTDGQHQCQCHARISLRRVSRLLPVLSSALRFLGGYAFSSISSHG